jgi:hypothetical protein
MPDASADRKSTRCPHCELNQYELASGKCRRCNGWLRPEYAPVALLPPESDPELAAVPQQPVDAFPSVIPSSIRPPAPPMFWLPVILLYLRLQSGLSQRQLAQRMHTDRIYVSKVECGVRPTLHSFERYAQGLGVTMQKIVEMCEVLAVRE